MKKFLCAFLALMTLVSCVSCATTDSEPGSTDTSVGQSESVAATESDTPPQTETETELSHDVEKADYNGATFHMIAQENAVGYWYYAEEYLSGGGDDKYNILNNTIYEMNTQVTEHLNVTFEYDNIDKITDANVVYNTVVRTMMAGDDEYQLCILHPYCSVYSFVTKNQALDFYTLDDLNLERDWWNADVMEQLSIKDHAFVGMGDICNYNLFILYANREILEDAGREIPYDLVYEGAWTIDEFAALTAGIYRDNGDGERNNVDTYGFAGLWDINGAAFLQAADIYILSRNEQNGFELSMYGDRLVDYYGKLLKWASDPGTYLWNMKQWSDPSISMDFHDGLSAITQWSLSSEFLDAEFEYGILPLPKYDQAQEEYSHVNWGNNIIVPNTVENKAMVGQVLELMAYYTRTNVRETFYNDVLQLRVSERPDDREMVELICNTVTFDPGIAYCLGNEGLYDLVYTTCHIRDGMENIASYYTQNERSVNRMLEKLPTLIKD